MEGFVGEQQQGFRGESGRVLLKNHCSNVKYPCIDLEYLLLPQKNATIPPQDLFRESQFDSYQDCALLVCGDFNRCGIKRLTNAFRLKQIIKVPTRKNVTLDFIITNLYTHYCDPQASPPFGLSDHSTIVQSYK